MYILILTIIAVCGALAVAKGQALVANVLWVVSNPLMAVYNFRAGELELAGMFLVYSVIAIYGLWNLKLKNMVL